MKTKQVLIALLSASIIVSSVSGMTSIVNAEDVLSTKTISMEMSENKLHEITLDKTEITLSEGDNVNLVAKIISEVPTEEIITWDSSDSNIVEVDDGNITAVSAGTATITASLSDGVSASCTVKIKLKKPQVSANPTQSNITLKWDKNFTANGYHIYRSISKNGTYKKIATVTGKNTYIDKNIILGKIYYYKVVAYHSQNIYNSDISDPVKAKAVLGKPIINTIFTVTSSSIKFSWEKVNSATGYYVYRRKNTNENWKKITTVKGTDYKDVLSGKYYYSVSAYKILEGKTIVGPKSDEVCFKTMKKTTVSDNKSKKPGNYKVTWKSVSGATGYQVYFRTGENGKWKKIATVGKVTSYTYNHGVYGKYIYCKVRPIYINNGVTSLGEFSDSSLGNKWYRNPSFDVWMSPETQMNCSFIGINVVNTGEATVRIYSKYAMLNDHDYDSYDRDLTLVNGDLKNIPYVDIKPRQEKWLWFKCDKTWYDEKTSVLLQMKCDGEEHVGSFSSYYGYRIIY